VSESKSKAVFLADKARFEVGETQKPVIVGSDDVLIRIKSVGVCGSDRHYFIDGCIGSQVVDFPQIMGHECAGIIEETGSAVTRVKPGDRVAVEPQVVCGKCSFCQSSNQNFCLNLKFLGIPGEMDGCMQEFLVMPENNVFPVQPDTSLEDAVISEPLAICLHGIKLCGITGGMSVALIGSGTMGLLTMAAAKASGASTAFATDKIPERVEMARKMGADGAFNPDKTDVVQEIMDRTDGLGVDAAFECAGDPEALLQCLEVTRKGGVVGLVGIYSPEVMVKFNSETMRRRGLRTQNVRRQVHQTENALRMVASGQIDAKTLITHRFNYDQSNQAYDLVSNYKDGVVKAIINF
jgi:L-iditol 2-dehydrogenase